jgi:hypothetical protein
MSAKYSLLVFIIVAALLMLNSLWLSQPDVQPCIGCEQSQ